VLFQGFESAAISLGKENDINSQEVESITVYCGTNAMRISGTEEKRIPSTPVHAQFSAYYKVASGIVRRCSTPAEYTEEAIQDRAVLDLCRKTELVLRPEYDTGFFYEKGGRIEIKTNRKSKPFSTDVHIPKGHPENPMTWKDFGDKMKAAAGVCIKPVPEDNLTTLLKMVKKLEDVDDVSEIIRLLVF